MANSDRLNFTQRNGQSPLPQQLALGQLSPRFIALTWGAIYSDMQKDVIDGYSSSYFGARWRSIIYDFNIDFLHNTSPNKINYDVMIWENLFDRTLKGGEFGKIFNFIEYIYENKNILPQTKGKIRDAFEKSHLAYRMLEDGTIIAIGTEEQAAAVLKSLELASTHSAGTSSHLKAAGSALAREDWAASVRESITAVESAARILAGESSTLGDALKELSKKNTLNPLLKSAFEKLYAYTNAEGGIRHANVFSDKANVDEDDALFMLGACASFVTFLLSKRSSS